MCQFDSTSYYREHTDISTVLTSYATAFAPRIQVPRFGASFSPGTSVGTTSTSFDQVQCSQSSDVDGISPT